MDIFRIVLGGLLLTLGRRLYWLFVAGFGFLFGLRLAGSLFQNAPNWVILLIGFFIALGGAVLAVTLQKIGIGLAGFFAGAYIAFSLMDGLDGDPASWYWLVYLLGGVVGAILLSMLFEWALILLSAIGGSIILVQALDLGQPWSVILYMVLLTVGVGLQAGLFRGRSRASPG
ncbi:MAG: DUF4203 domain-containing protein [Anaerolineales bacterium]